MPKVKGQKSSKVMLSGKQPKFSKKTVNEIRSLVAGTTKVGWNPSQLTIQTSQFSGSLVTNDRTSAGKGFLQAPGRDRVFVKKYSVFVTITLDAIEFTTGVPAVVRHLLLWCKKASTPPPGLGGYDEFPNVLQKIDVTGSLSASIYSPLLPAGDRPNPFVVLSDTYYDVGSVFNLGGALTTYVDGPLSKTVKLDVPVNRWTTFEEPPTEAIPGGHYSSTTAVGRVSSGFLLSAWIPSVSCILYGNEYVTYE